VGNHRGRRRNLFLGSAAHRRQSCSPALANPSKFGLDADPGPKSRKPQTSPSRSKGFRSLMGLLRIGRWLARGAIRLRAGWCLFRWVVSWRRSTQNDICLEMQKQVPPLRASRSGRDGNKRAKATAKTEVGSLRCASGFWITSRRLRAGDPSASLGMTTERQKRSASRWSHISQLRRDMGHPPFGDPSTLLGMTTKRGKGKGRGNRRSFVVSLLRMTGKELSRMKG
jgi:hypothetical protein